MNTFDWETYILKYPDLKDFDKTQALRHFRLFGKAEGRTDQLESYQVDQSYQVFDENGNDCTNVEVSEQQLAREYILPSDTVLELGARYGSVSCCINKRLNNKQNQVVVEPDQRVWEALENNKKINNCNFHIIKGFISNSILDLTDHLSYNGYGTTSVKSELSTIPSYTLDSLGLNFNVLVADCEGFLETFFDENPNFVKGLRLVLFEADRSDICDYSKIKKLLTGLNFKEILGGHQNVYQLL